MRGIKYKLSVPEDHVIRQHHEPFPSEPYRDDFQRDRDRILLSKAFRRLSGKTQVFLPLSHDHVRTRLTHTLEVAQISKIVSKNLRLNGILSEAIAMGHDIGHTPFGHVGERTLNQIMNGCDKLAEFQDDLELDDQGFKHNFQSIRVACELENLYDSPGINLSNFTLWGIKNHSSLRWKKCAYTKDNYKYCYLKRDRRECIKKDGLKIGFYKKYDDYLINIGMNQAWTFEAYVVGMADEISQRHHDIEDAIFMGIFSKDEFVDVVEEHFYCHFDREDKKLFNNLKKIKNDISSMPYMSKFITGLLCKQLIRNSIDNLNKFIDDCSINSRAAFIDIYKNTNPTQTNEVVSYSAEFAVAERKFQEFLMSRVLNSFEVQRMDGKGQFIIRRLFKAYLSNPRQLHDGTIVSVFRLYKDQNNEYTHYQLTEKGLLGELRNKIDSPNMNSDVRFQIALLRTICDHIAGMTDNFALSEHERLYGT